MIHVDPASIAPRPAPAGAPARALIERRLAALTRLADIGMEIAEAAGRQATAAEDHAEALGAASLAYTRAARAVRLTFALQSRLLDELATLERADGAARMARHARLHRLAERAIEAEPDLDDGEFDRLSSAFRERLTEAEDDAELLDRPFAQAVAAICADLGLSPDWTARIAAAAEPVLAGRDRAEPEGVASAPAAAQPRGPPH